MTWMDAVIGVCVLGVVIDLLAKAMKKLAAVFGAKPAARAGQRPPQRAVSSAAPAVPSGDDIPLLAVPRGLGKVLAKNLMVTVDIEYRDAEGNVSQRRITIQHVVEPRHLIAWCHARRAERTFLLSGIVRVVDPQTGEIGTPPGPWLMQRLGLQVPPPDPKSWKLCPSCQGRIDLGLSICPYCQHSFLAAAPELPLVPPQQPKTPAAADADAYVLDFQRQPVRVLLRYLAASGEESERTVAVRRLFGRVEGETVVFHSLSGVCEMRHQTRTFRLNRIEQAADADTGEVIRDLAAWLAPKGVHR